MSKIDELKVNLDIVRQDALDLTTDLDAGAAALAYLSAFNYLSGTQKEDVACIMADSKADTERLIDVLKKQDGIVQELGQLLLDKEDA